MNRTCERCGASIADNPRRGKRQADAARFCSRQCLAMRAHERYDDLADLIDLGESPRIAAQRVGTSVAAAARWYYRHGRADLARMFARTQKTERASA